MLGYGPLVKFKTFFEKTITAGKDVEELLERAAKGVNLSNHRKDWLGPAITDEDVQLYTDRLLSEFLGKVTVTVKKSNLWAKESFAATRPFEYRGDKRFGEEWVYDAKCNVYVGERFFSDDVSRGERAQSILHELTHLALATYDWGLSGDKLVRIDKKDHPECSKAYYGADRCAELISKDSNKACTNAENWGFYFLAYRIGLGWTNDEQLYLTSKSCKEIRGKRWGKVT